MHPIVYKGLVVLKPMKWVLNSSDTAPAIRLNHEQQYKADFKKLAIAEPIAAATKTATKRKKQQ